MGFLDRLRNRLTGFAILNDRLDEVGASLASAAAAIEAVRTQLDSLPTREMVAALPRKDDISPLPTRNEVKQMTAEMLAEWGSQTKHEFAALWARHADIAEVRANPFRLPAPPKPPHEGPIVERIGFLVHSLELRNHYACIWDLLPPGTFDVLLHGEAAALADGSEFAQWRCKVNRTDELLASNTKYRYLVSNHPVAAGDPPLIYQLALINVRFMYAAGKSGWNLADWNNLYDVILCFGPYHAQNFSYCSNAVIIQMGYPRFDRYFAPVADRRMLAEQFNCDPSRETVVWLPTWHKLSSVGWFDEEISALASRYNVVVKLHPLMLESDPGKVAALRKRNFSCLITDSRDNLPLYQLADFMLFDYGGPPLAGVYTDKRMLLLDVPDAQGDALLGQDSPDVVIRRHLPRVGHAEGGIAALLADEALWKRHQAPRRMLRGTYFAPHFGFAAQVAAQALLNLDKIVAQKEAS